MDRTLTGSNWWENLDYPWIGKTLGRHFTGKASYIWWKTLKYLSEFDFILKDECWTILTWHSKKQNASCSSKRLRNLKQQPVTSVWTCLAMDPLTGMNILTQLLLRACCSTDLHIYIYKASLFHKRTCFLPVLLMHFGRLVSFDSVCGSVLMWRHKLVCLWFSDMTQPREWVTL